MTDKLLVITVIVLCMAVGVLLFDKIRHKSKITTEEIEMGGFIISVENGNLSIKPKER